MYSLNVPVPSHVAALAAQIAAQIPGARPRRRGEHTLVVKRLGTTDPHRLSARAREAVSGVQPFEIRVDRVEQFSAPPTGSAPVVYLAVDSREIAALHERLLAEFSPAEEIEGAAYVPHVTVARGGDEDVVEQATGAVEPVAWTVTELVVWDGTYQEPIERIALPG